MSSSPALLLIGHGSRSSEGVDQFWAFVDLLRAIAPRIQLGTGLIELAEPNLDQAVDELVAAGAQAIIAVPLVLLGASHLKDDGPGALSRGRARHPEVAFTYARDLGVHPVILALVEERVREAAALLGDAGDSEPSAILLVGRGSSDPDANADLAKAARLLADRRHLLGGDDLEEVQAAFVSLARPSVHEGLDRLFALGARRIAVVPYFLFTGVLLRRIGSQAEAWAAARPTSHVRVGRELGPDERIARLVLERYEEAAGGGARMNCDGCLYRVPLPGYEGRFSVLAG